MKLFVTGGTGFIGSHFVKQALEAGHEVVALRRSDESKPRIELQTQPQWVTAPLDEVPEQAFEGCEAVVHLAAHTPNLPYDTLENCIRWNVLAPLQLFRVAISTGIDCFVVAGSCFEYGRSGERYEFIPTDAPLEPIQTYPASKAMASIAFTQLAIECKLRLSIHRIFQVYGEGESESRFWPSLHRAALAGEDFEMTNGEQIRDFVHVAEVASKLLEAATSIHLHPGIPVVQNLGSGKPQTLRDFAMYWWTKWNASRNLRYGTKPQRIGEVMRYVPEMPTNVDS